MENKVRKDGTYEMFQTTKKHAILSLDNKEWYAVVKGQLGDMLVGSDSDHEKSKTLSQGKYILIEFKDDPEFNDVPHFFLENSGRYDEWILPQEFPKGKGDKVKLVKTRYKVDSQKIDAHIQGRLTGKSSGKKEDDLESKSKTELLDMAKKQNVKGRSKMSKDELLHELEPRLETRD